MAVQLGGRRAGAAVLVIALVAAIGIFGTPARYPAPVAFLLSLVQLLLIAAGAATMAVPAWRSGEEERRQIAIAGMLLLLPWALLALMPGYGPPFASNLAMNHVRYVILFVSAALLGAGLFLLRDPLGRGEGGDRLFAPLGQAAGLLATPIQLVWGAVLIGWTMSEAHRPPDYLPLYGTPLGNASDVLLFFAGLFTYLSTGFYALSFARRGWLGRTKAGAAVALAAIAVAALVTRGLQYPDLSEDWFTVPGMIVGIPAIPWLMPYLLGVSALFHAAGDRGRVA